jgi:hypothetical protein
MPACATSAKKTVKKARAGRAQHGAVERGGGEPDQAGGEGDAEEGRARRREVAQEGVGKGGEGRFHGGGMSGLEQLAWRRLRSRCVIHGAQFTADDPALAVDDEGEGHHRLGVAAAPASGRCRPPWRAARCSASRRPWRSRGSPRPCRRGRCRPRRGPFLAYLSWAAVSSGISFLQGPHQRAQKFTISGLPFSCARAKGLSSRSCSVAVNKADASAAAAASGSQNSEAEADASDS